MFAISSGKHWRNQEMEPLFYQILPKMDQIHSIKALNVLFTIFEPVLGIYVYPEPANDIHIPKSELITSGKN